MSEVTTVAQVNPADLELLNQFGLTANVQQTEKINSVSIKGGKWRYMIDGEVKTVEIDTPDGKFAAPSIKAIVLNQIPTRSYAMFEGTYEDGANTAPTCYSLEGKSPDIDQGAKAPAGVTSCASCPKRAVGSAFVNGDENKPTRACKESKRIAVVLAQEPTHTPLKLQLPVTSLWEDKSSAQAKEADGWRAWDSHVKYLASQGIAHTAMVSTICKFDSDVSSPKILFKMGERLTTEQLHKVLPLVNSAEVQKVLGLNREPRVAQATIETQAPVAQVESKPAPAQTAPASVAPAPIASVAPQEAVKAAEPVAEKPKAAAKSAPKVEEASATVADQLSDW